MNSENNVLPQDFDGVFRFTNATERDFTAKWNSIEYTFPAMKTTPMIIPNATPLEVQNIRKKFARELAEREFYLSPKLKSLEAQTPAGSVGSFRMAALYTPSDLEPFVQQCLEPLPVAKPIVKVVPKEEPKLRTDNKGKKVTRVLEEGESLVGEGQVIG